MAAQSKHAMIARTAPFDYAKSAPLRALYHVLSQPPILFVKTVRIYGYIAINLRKF
jgi:hypothetical protein